MTKKTVFSVVLFFTLSIIIRLPNLNRPLSKHHEFNAAFFLIPMEIWYKTSGWDYNFSPVLNYGNKGDKKINNFLGENTECQGNYYYLSFGPGAYIFPYLILSPFGIPSVLGLQIFSLFIHLLCALLLIKIAHWFLDKKGLDVKDSIWAGIFYLFLPISLWFHGNGYTHHSLVVLLYLGAFYSFLKLIDNQLNVKHQLFLFIFLSLGIYTEWITCFLAFVIFIYSLRNKYYKIVLISIIAVFISIGIIFYQYSTIIGFEKFIIYLKDRFLVRNNLNSNGISYVAFLFKIGYWCIVGFGSFLILLLFSLFHYFKNKSFLKINIYGFIFVSPILLHHFIFPEFTFAHDYSILIDASFFCLFTLVIFVKYDFTNHRYFRRILFFVFVGLIFQYYFINRPGKISQTGEAYANFKLIGEYIQKNAKNNELVVLSGVKDLPNPQIVYYSKRNFYSLKNSNQLNNLIKSYLTDSVFYCQIRNDNKVNSKHLILNKGNNFNQDDFFRK